MKEKIKLIIILGGSLFITGYFLRYQSPEMMARDLKFKLIHNRLSAGILSKTIKNKPSMNIPRRVKVDYLVKPAKAREKIIVEYKGKKLEIWATDPDKTVLDKDDLEFFYQLELLREKNKK